MSTKDDSTRLLHLKKLKKLCIEFTDEFRHWYELWGDVVGVERKLKKTQQKRWLVINFFFPLSSHFTEYYTKMKRRIENCK